MITIYRRIRAAAGEVTATEWLLVTLEGFLVFLGIFAAFQLEQWAEGNRERRASEALVDRLLTESQDTVSQLRDYVENGASAIAMVQQEQARLLNENKCPSPKAMGIGAIPTPVLPTGVYDEVIGAGGLSLLPDPQVRERIASFHTMRSFFDGQVEYARRIQFPMMPLMIETGMRPDVHENGPVRWVSVPGRQCSDENLKARFAFNVQLAQRMHQWAEYLLERSIKMCAVLADANGKECLPSDNEPLSENEKEIAKSAFEHEGRRSHK